MSVWSLVLAGLGTVALLAVLAIVDRLLPDPNPDPQSECMCSECHRG